VFPNAKPAQLVPNAVPKLFGSNVVLGNRGNSILGDPLAIVTGIFPRDINPGGETEPAGCLAKVNSTSWLS